MPPEDRIRIQEELDAMFDRGQVKKREGKYEYVEIRPVIQRLNDVLGYSGWSFKVTSTAETNLTLMVWGEMTVHTNDQDATRMQCGRKAIAFKKNSDVPLDIGNDWKSATSDCIKKCATLFGVGLYLSDDEYQPDTRENNPSPPRDTTSGSKKSPPAEDTPDSIGALKTAAFELEKNVLRLTGETRIVMRERVLGSKNLPDTENGLMDYQAKLTDLLKEGGSA